MYMQHAKEFIVCNTVLCINKFLWLQCEKEFVNNISYDKHACISHKQHNQC